MVRLGGHVEGRCAASDPLGFRGFGVRIIHLVHEFLLAHRDEYLDNVHSNSDIELFAGCDECVDIVERVNALGQPIDGKGPLPQGGYPVLLKNKPPPPQSRKRLGGQLDLGVRVVNSFLAMCEGQRMGIFAGSGVGKSVLMSMLARNTDCDVAVIGLIGERAREVGAFVRNVMTGESAARTCVVATPADRSPLLRLRSAFRATAIAEYFRAQGKEVLLIIDSLTRVAHAKREVGLALGEQPTAKGYPPSVVSLIPSLIERAGPGLAGQGSITAFYTILADGDDAKDPVVDTARATLDGHLVLSRKQAQMGLYPAIDIPQSVSRVMNDIVTSSHAGAARKLRRLISLYLENRDLMLMGGYSKGQDPDLDEAIALWPDITALITQNSDEPATFDDSLLRLMALTGGER